MNTPIADMVAEMLDSGTPKETIILAVRTTELAMQGSRPVDVTAEKRRAWDRDYRQRKKSDPPDSTRIPPEHASSFLGEKRSMQEVVIKKEIKSRGTKIPPDWKPNEKHFVEGLSRGMTRAAVEELAETLRLWCASNANTAKTTRADWDSFFMSWVRREKKVGNGFSNGHTVSSAGRANAKETQLIAAMGRGAVAALGKSISSGRDGQASGSHGFAAGDGFDGRTKNVG